MSSIQVRRTDKVGTEAAFHGIEEYMKHVDEWYDSYEMRHDVQKRRVFLASDDPSVLQDAKKKFGELELLCKGQYCCVRRLRSLL